MIFDLYSNDEKYVAGGRFTEADAAHGFAVILDNDVWT